ncbi:MAG: hypothetical protein AAGF11_13020 [Myxococcota bacterium]
MLLACTGCTEFEGVESDFEFDDEIEFRGGGGTPGRRPGGGGGPWLGNGLQSFALSGVSTQHGLSTSEGLSEDTGLLADPAYWDTVEYLVECALPFTESITKNVVGTDGPQTKILSGLVGLAPEWKDGACDQDCQEWVTSCLLARTNLTGHTVWLGLRAEHPAVGTHSDPDYPLHEASWYGNLFAPTPQMYFCRGSSTALSVAYQQGRTCSTGHHEDCGFTSLGSCYGGNLCAGGGGGADGNDPVTHCSSGDKEYKTLSTYIDIPQGWTGWDDDDDDDDDDGDDDD